MVSRSIEKQQNGKRCADVLAVADAIIACLAKHRKKTGIHLNARIGIATGRAVAGM